MTDWISTKTVTQMLGVGSTTIKRWADSGKLPYIRTAGGHRRFQRDTVRRILWGQLATSKYAAIDRWINLLTGEYDVIRIPREIYQLRDRLGGWYLAADFLDDVMLEVWSRHSNNDSKDAPGLIAASSLDRATAAISMSFAAESGAPIGLLAPLAREQHSHRRSLIQLCARSERIDLRRTDAKTPIKVLTSHIRNQELHLVVLCAEDECAGDDPDIADYRQISDACQDACVELIICFERTKLDFGNYGRRCRSFAELGQLLEHIA